MNRELLRLALDALEGLFGAPDHMMGGGGGVAVWRLGGSAPVRDAIEALKQELAKPEPEPVAFLCHGHPYLWPSQDDFCGNPEDHIPLYAAPTEPNCRFPTCHSQEYQRELVKEIIEDKDTASW